MSSSTTTDVCSDPVILDQWHPITAVEDAEAGRVGITVLLDRAVSFTLTDGAEPVVWLARPDLPAGVEVDAAAVADALPSMVAYGYVWTCLGTPPGSLFAVDEYSEPDRRNIHAVSIGIGCSAPRAVENFLDMGHFPFVHTHYLGEEPHTEVVDYEVTVDPTTNEIWATECVFWQPMAAASATGGQMVDYLYRVPHPYCTLLYKSCPADDTRMDVVGLLNQPVSAEEIQGHMFLSYIDSSSTTAAMRSFTQIIFGQDKPILENQYPKRLPLDPRAETPIRADRVAIAYHRWLSDMGVTYGVVPAGTAP